MKNWILFCLLGLLMTSCAREQLDASELNYNVIDPDYEGEAFIEYIDDITYIVYDIYGDPIDTVLGVNVQVRRDLMLIAINYTLVATSLTTGSTASVSNINNAEGLHRILFSHVEDGDERCFSAKLRVDGTDSRSYDLCGTAQL